MTYEPWHVPDESFDKMSYLATLYIFKTCQNSYMAIWSWHFKKPDFEKIELEKLAFKK